MDFVPLVKTVREYQYSLSAKKKPLRSGVALDLMDNYSWPIGEEGYTTFRRYTQAAETAEFVHLGDCKYGPTIYSTGRLEGILNSQFPPSIVASCRFLNLPCWFRSQTVQELHSRLAQGSLALCTLSAPPGRIESEALLRSDKDKPSRICRTD